MEIVREHERRQRDTGATYQLNGAHISAAYWENPHSPRTDAVWLQLCTLTLDALSQYLNFTYAISRISAHTDPIALVHANRVQLLVNFLAVTPNRSRYVTFLEPFIYSHKTFLVRASPPAPGFSLLGPFDALTWSLLLAVAVMTAVAMAMNGRLCLPCMTWGDARRRVDARAITDLLKYYVRYVFGALVRQGGPWLPAAAPVRTVLAAWWLFAICASTIYSASLVSLLTVVRVREPFTSIPALLRHPAMTPVVVAGQSVVEQLATSPANSSLHRLLERVAAAAPRSVAKSLPEGLRLTLLGNHTLIGNALELKLLIIEEAEAVFSHEDDGEVTCALMLSSVEMLPTRMAWMVPRGSPYVRSLNNGIRAAIESGLRDKWLHEALPDRLELCRRPRKNIAVTTRQLTSVDLSGAISVLVYGGISAVVVLCLEKFIYHAHNALSEGQQWQRRRQRLLLMPVAMVTDDAAPQHRAESGTVDRVDI
ncbi:PREDICTED: glutamate receptor ionotropic, delta-2-like [Priapulus caudatus]|uniref:Glutamate receptor ionotropic, delta-2-like n=1 Tax=Priapulus caudatus TaxID=37621 RepID=A0ABM1EXS9_PRICU|nr:PREDICTED: glutamate receptor ionotropic, delta-2-like [Priapulus caudatus]